MFPEILRLDECREGEVEFDLTTFADKRKAERLPRAQTIAMPKPAVSTPMARTEEGAEETAPYFLALGLLLSPFLRLLLLIISGMLAITSPISMMNGLS